MADASAADLLSSVAGLGGSDVEVVGHQSESSQNAILDPLEKRRSLPFPEVSEPWPPFLEVWGGTFPGHFGGRMSE